MKKELNFEDVLLKVKTREDFRNWLILNAKIKKQCFVFIKMKEANQKNKALLYLHAVEEAICFGWIDSIFRKDEKGRLLVRFSPRRKNSNWTELNKQRARRMIALNKMTKLGREVLPNLDEEFKIDDEILEIFNRDEDLLKKIKLLPELYLKIKIDNISKVKNNRRIFNLRIAKFIKATKELKLYGKWKD